MDCFNNIKITLQSDNTSALEMQLSNNHSLLIISALAETSANTLHTKIHRNGNIIIPTSIKSASDSK